MRRLLANPLVGYLVLLLLIAAVLQSAGRMAMSLLDEFEEAVNAYLGEQVSITGLSGGWRGVNPVVRMDRLQTPTGWAEQVLIEFDWLETLMRNRPVMQRLFVERAALAIEHTKQGWRLAGALGQWPEFDWGSLLYDADEVRLRGELSVLNAADSTLIAHVQGVNRDGLHGFDLAITSPQCAQDCTLRLHWRAKPNRWTFQPGSRQLTVSGAVPLPPAYLPWLDLKRSIRLGANGQWAQRGLEGGGEFIGRLALEATEAGSPTVAKLQVEAPVLVASFGALHKLAIPEAKLSNADRTLKLKPILAKGDLSAASIWTSELPLHELSEFLIKALDADNVAKQWLEGVRPRGTLSNVQVDASSDGVAYAATLSRLQISPYRGMPMLRDANGSLTGYEQGLALSLNSPTLDVHFADTFTKPWRLANVQALIQCWFGNGYLGARSPNLRAELPHGTLVATFALSRPANRLDQRLSLQLRLERLQVSTADAYVPYTLPSSLGQWLLDAPLDGVLSDLRLAYQGQVHSRPQDYSRRVAITAELSGGEVRYHPEWPIVTGVNGSVLVSGEDVFAQVESATSQGLTFQDNDIHVGRNGAFAEIELRTQADAGAAMNYIRSSPIHQWLSFVQPEWDGTGQLAFNGKLFVPLDEHEETRHPFDANLAIKLMDVGLELPNYRLSLADLNGDATYRFPYMLNSEPIKGALFDQPATLTASSDDAAVAFQIAGVATPAAVYQLADMEDYGLASGSFPYDATLSIPVDDRPARLNVQTALEGLELHLPGEFGKASPSPRATTLDLEFLEEHVAMQLRHGVVQGWLHVDERPLRGALGVRRQPPAVPAKGDEVVVAGRTDVVDVYQWSQGDGLEFPAPWRLEGVDVGQVAIESTRFADVRVTGAYRDGLMTLAFDSEHLKGSLRSQDDDPLRLRFDSIVLPAEDFDDEQDPLDISLIDRLPEADVVIRSIFVGDEDFGRWSFSMRPQEDGVLLGDLEAQLKDTEITSAEGVFWSRSNNRSAATAQLKMEDLYKVLPQWDYEPSLHSKSAELNIDGSWPGSPLNVSVDSLTAEAFFFAKDGRFLEMDSGVSASRIFSLLNFTTIAKRMNLDFKDVTGKGISFDTIKANARFDNGTMNFLEPAKMKGSGADFKISGSIDVVAGEMNNNEIIVTLPVSASLPWYAVYVSLANPAAGLAVLAGQQVLKNQINQFSSAKYQVNGPWDDPEVKLVAIWNDSLQAFNELPDEPASTSKGDE